MSAYKLSGPLAHTTDDGWIALGWYYGYPECCIQAFENMEHLISAVGKDRQLYGTGYVVCDTCNETKSVYELLRFVAEHRHPDAPPFPLTDADIPVLMKLDDIIAEFNDAHGEVRAEREERAREFYHWTDEHAKLHACKEENDNG